MRQRSAPGALRSSTDNHPFELSQGQKRRLALASLTIADRWPLLVLDEPMAGLDAHGAAHLAAEILTLRDKGRTVALITHDMDLALRLCAAFHRGGGGRHPGGGADRRPDERQSASRPRRIGGALLRRRHAMAGGRRMLKALNPLSKLAVCCIWLVAAVLIFDARFQLAAILVPALALVASQPHIAVRAACADGALRALRLRLSHHEPAVSPGERFRPAHGRRVPSRIARLFRRPHPVPARARLRHDLALLRAHHRSRPVRARPDAARKASAANRLFTLRRHAARARSRSGGAADAPRPRHEIGAPRQAHSRSGRSWQAS